MSDFEISLQARGVKACNYHLAPPFHSQVGKKSVVYHFGYPTDVMEEYLDPAVLETNPTPDYVMHVGRLMTWTEAIEGRELSQAQMQFVSKCRDLGYKNGLAIPLFGPNYRNSFSSFLFDEKIILPGEELIIDIANLAQTHHYKFCKIIDRDKKRTILISKREKEVLYWIARGKSNKEISSVLKISPDTVATFVKRLFVKLGVNSRISATIEGLSKGMLEL